MRGECNFCVRLAFLPVNKICFPPFLHYLCPYEIRQSADCCNSGVPGFDSRLRLMVSTSSAVWRLVNPDAQKLVGNNNYALAA